MVSLLTAGIGTKRIGFLLLLCAGGAALAETGPSTPLASLNLALEGLPQHPLEGRALANESVLARAIYAKAGSLLWSKQGQISGQARELVQYLQAADSFGLQPQDYGMAPL
jgi:murein L,D-transpeptidase YcbB/YkuD